MSIADLMKVLGEGSDVIVRPKGRGFQVKTLSDERELRKARRRAWLAQADALREQIAARVGGPLPDSVNELRELREERTDELAGLRFGDFLAEAGLPAAFRTANYPGYQVSASITMRS